MNWYYAEGKRKIGPISKEEFRSLAQAKKINSKTLVWRPGMKDWQELGEIVKQKSSSSQEQQKAVTPGKAVCSECGETFSEDEMISFENAKVCAGCKPVFVQKIKEGVSVAGIMEYAGFWIRFGAKFIDWVILGIIGWILFIPAGILIPSTKDTSLVFIIPVVMQLFNIVIAAAYTTWFLGKFGATPGKMACKLKVVQPDASMLSYPRALGRHFAEWISGMILMIGYIMAAFDDQKRSLHDRICETRVIRK